MSEWSEDKCFLLIDAYKEHTVLWDPNDKDYYKKHLKEDAWAKIGGIMNETGEACKQKMINLLASYRRERMKIKKSVGTGKGKNKIYKSKWYAFKVLRFLDDRFSSRKGLESGGANEQEDKNDNANSPTVSPESCNKKLKPDPKLRMLKEAFDILKNTANKSQQDMELRFFFDFIQEKMKNYTKDTKNAVQHEIFQIIMRADQGYYNSIKKYSYYSQQAPCHPIATNQTPYSDLNIAGPSTFSSAQNEQSPLSNPPYSPYSSKSDHSSDLNFKESV